MKTFELEFSYLGDRDYLDVTSILDSFWQALGPNTRTAVRNMDFRIHAPFNENCTLYYQENSVPSYKNDPCAKFTWLIEGKKYFGFLVPNGQKIVKRSPEPKWDFEQHCEFRDGKMYLTKNFNQDVCYSLTKTGKFLISKYRDPAVKVVRFKFNELMLPEELVGTSLRMQEMSGTEFIKVICEKNDKEFGFIVVTTKTE